MRSTVRLSAELLLPSLRAGLSIYGASTAQASERGWLPGISGLGGKYLPVGVFCSDPSFDALGREPTAEGNPAAVIV